MREIKFRAWFKPLKRMYIVRELNFKRDGSIIVITNHTGGTAPNSYEIMQFTGLKDKNGKEIYEGDILVTSNDGKDRNDIWKEGEWGYFQVKINNILGVSIITESENPINFNDSMSCMSIQFLKIIGNIYENPDLIADKKELNSDGGKNGN